MEDTVENTVHGIKQICARTTMRPEDVLLIISSGAAVELESTKANGYRYHLFYSPPDRKTKIALTGMRDGKTCLVSIWERDFVLPDWLSSITGEIEREARLRMREFLFSRIKKSQNKRFDTKIDVYVGMELIHTHDSGHVTPEDAESFDSVLLALRPHLTILASLIERKQGDKRAVNYRVRFLDIETSGPAKPPVMFKHKTLKKHLSSAA